MTTHTEAQTAEIHDLHAAFPQSQSDLLDAPFLRAIADLADSRGPARFTPGGGVLFSKPLSREERKALPVVEANDVRYIDLPQDRFQATRASNPAFRTFIDSYTVPHMRAGYRLVVIPLTHGLDAAQLRAIADAAEAFGHGTIRLTADVSIRLPNVPSALLRPLFAALSKTGLLERKEARKAA